MWSQYDENLSENAFYKEISTQHSDILTKTSEEGWIITVPRQGSWDINELNFETILDHILIHDEGSEFSTLSKKHLTVQDKRILTENSLTFNNPVEILFEETFYIDKNLKCTVWCVERPLFIKYVSKIHHKICLENVHDCIDFLWVESLSHQLLEHIQIQANEFILQHENFETENLQEQKDLLGKLYSQCLQTCLKNTHIRDKSSNPIFLENLKISVETYMHYCLGRKLLSAVNTLMCNSDSQFNKITRNSSYLQLQDLNIPSSLSDIVTAVKCELNKINSFVTILDKINCLQRTFKLLNSYDIKYCFTTDDVLNILVFVILKLNINNWYANLVYIKDYKFSSLNVHNDFFLTSIEAALEFIRSNEFLGIKVKSIRQDVSSQFAVQYVFDYIRLGNLKMVKSILKQKKVKANIEQNLSLCHPLCSCDECEKILKNLEKQIDVNIDSKNENGQSLLTVAVLYGHCDLVEFFLTNNCNINTIDYLCRTPLHYAASKGYQDILLLLINFGANVNAVDGEKNTPLHLASENGHENCVKALIYSSVNIKLDLCNFFGDTPMHLAAKWSYLEILKILSENGGYAHVKNRRSKTALDIASNYYSRVLLEDAPEIITNNNSEPDSSLEIIDCGQVILNSENHGVKPRNLEQLKKVDLLLKAIENNDLPLTCFYLGFNIEINETEELKEKCHPLCYCPKCTTDGEFLISNKKDAVLSVNTCNGFGYTPLHMAAKFGRHEILRLLLDSSAQLNVKTYSTLYTPLHLACMNQRIKVIKELLNCGSCKIDEPDSKGNTPLFYAATKGFTKIVEILLNNGADVKKKNMSGKTILQEVEDRQLFGISAILNENNKEFTKRNDGWVFF